MNLTKVQVYGSIIISTLICCSFILVIYEAYSHGDQHTVDSLNGALVSAFMIVVGYWVGSSSGSQKKDALLLNSIPVTDITTPPPDHPSPKAL